MTQYRELAFELLRSSLTQLRFDADAVERVRAQIIANLAREAEDPDDIAGKAWWRMVFPDHPYGRPVSGTPETVAAITVDDLRRAVATGFVRKHLILGFVGDITPAELGPLLDKTLLDCPRMRRGHKFLSPNRCSAMLP